MKIHVRQDGHVTVVSVEGNLVIGQPEAEFKKAVTRLIEAGNTNLLVDLGWVEVLDSSGLGALVRALTSSQREGGQTKLLHVRPEIRKLLEMTKLDSVFEMFDDMERAVSSF